MYVAYDGMKADPHGDTRFIGSVSLPFGSTFCRGWQWNKSLWLSGEAGPQFLLHRFGPGGVLPKCANCTSIKEVCRARRADEKQVLWDFSWQDSGGWEAQMQSRHLEMLYGSNIEHTRGLEVMLISHYVSHFF